MIDHASSSAATNAFLSGMIYIASMKGDETCPTYQFVRKNFALPRVKFFGWLITKNMINCESNLMQKRILREDLCAICNLDSETADHIIISQDVHLQRNFGEELVDNQRA